jgi:hypothetical protein
MTDDELITEVKAIREKRAKAMGGRKELLRRLSALSPDAILEAALGAYFPAERFIADAEVHERAFKYRKLERECARLIAKNKLIHPTNKRWDRNCERINEIFDEMDMIAEHYEGDPERTPMSKKFQRLAEVNARIAERKAKP